MLERTGMRFYRQDRIVVQFCKYDLVFGVRQVFYHSLYFLAQFFYLMVSLILEKYAYHIWQTDKFMFLGVFHDVIAYFTEPSRIIIVIRVIDDNLLPEYRSVQFESQYLSQRITVQIHIEYHRVVVGFVCEEHRQRCQHGSGDTLTEPYCPHSSTCHSVSGIV